MLTETAPHDEPVRSSSRSGRPALLVAFPEPRVLPVPVSGDVVGRPWLAGFGVVDPRVSSRQFVFTTKPGGALFVADADSKSGTFLNGRRLDPGEAARVEDGALVRVGKTIFVYRSEWSGGDSARDPIVGLDATRRLISPFGLVAVQNRLTALRARRDKVSAVLIEAPTGAGKEILAEAVATTLRPAKPFVPVNMAAIGQGVFESQLFGHVRGAFTGASVDAVGQIVAAAGGTIFFDELGELPLELQPKLLRFLENGEVQRVGASKPEKVDVAVVAATNRDLRAMVVAEKFRRDLLARIETIKLTLPPLAARPEDLWSIAIELRRRAREHYDPEQVQVAAIERLMLHDWPDNVRGLRATLERIALSVAPPALTLDAVEAELGTEPVTQPTRARAEEAIARNNGDKTAAARELGISRGKLLRMLKDE